MKKLLSTKYSAGAFSAAMLFLRLISGILILNGGYYKLTHFSEIQPKFINWLGIGTTASLSLVVFAEFFCAIFIILGLFTRLSSIPLIVTMCVVIFQVDKGNVFGDAQLPTLYLAAFLTLLLVGPGRVSVDNMISK
ncbi:MAG TPA: DoxX family protein [Ferruginibacter sp.]|nr:DoxX family protein [Ferruginibacter sp.]